MYTSHFPIHSVSCAVASGNGHVKVAKLLLENGANVNGKSSFGMTPLHYGKINRPLVLIDFRMLTIFQSLPHVFFNFSFSSLATSKQSRTD